jgi:hypothetical protein
MRIKEGKGHAKQEDDADTRKKRGKQKNIKETMKKRKAQKGRMCSVWESGAV